MMTFPTPRVVYLVRHGEVANPNHVVYADLPGFNLSPLGVRQAHAVAEHLAGVRIDAVVTSPLARAVQTANAIAERHGLVPAADSALGETRQYPAWTGHRWDDLDALFPGQLEAYLADPTATVDAGETVREVADRVVEVIAAMSARAARLAVVGHQDPLQAARLSMTGRPLSDLLTSPPTHASVVELASIDGTWIERSVWQPDIDRSTARPNAATAL